MNNWLYRAVITVTMVVAPLRSLGEDIDLFLGSTSQTDTPNVLFIFDNTANWNQPFTAEKAAFQSVFTSIKNFDQDINVGLMMFSETGGGNSNVDGGYVRGAIRSMQTKVDPTDPSSLVYADLYADMIDALHIRDDKSNGGKAGLTMMEAYLYFAGLAPQAGNNKLKTDWGIDGGTPGVTINEHYNHNNPNRATCCEESHPVWALDGSALDAENSTVYNSPVPANYCGGNYIIYISNGAAQDNNSDISRSESVLSSLGGDTTQIAISPSGSVSNPADEWARFMADSELGIKIFTLDVNKVTTGQGPGWTRLLESIADESGGIYYDVSTAGGADELIDALNNALTKILAVNSVFASVALPASSNTQSKFLNEVYMGQFRPDEDANPRWVGNMKHYKLALINNEVKTVDADEQELVDPTTGFIEQCSRSFWTPTATDTYWAAPLEPQGECTDPGFDPESNTPDGPIVEKGGQGYHLRDTSPAARNIKTCDPAFASCTALTDFNVANTDITGALLDPNNPLGAVARNALVAWGMGYDVADENGNTSTVDTRASVHQDVLHSQPVAVDFANDPNNPELVVFYGGNDGLLRAVNGNRTTTQTQGVNSTGPGDEFWSFMPPEFWSQLKRVATNTEEIKFPATGTAAGSSGSPKPYGMDGPITVAESGTDLFLYAGMRRGGRALYGFDVTDRWNPALKWKVGCPNLTNDTDCLVSPDNWSNIGQTWSAATVGSALGYSQPVLFVGGGYDACEDFDNGSTQNHSCSGSFKGNSVYVVDGDTGDILIEFATDRPVVGNVIAVPISNTNLNLDYAYVVDTGGNVYRISGQSGGNPAPIGSLDPSVSGNWIMTKIADLGCATTTDCALNRKFLFGADAVRVPGTSQIAILVGSGDREKPLEDYGAALNVDNYFFSLIDDPTDPAWLDYDAFDPDDFDCGSSVICMGSLATVDINGTVPPKKRGWKLALDAGEQVVSGALVLTEVANFSTHIPEPSAPDPNNPSCGGLGTATTYNIDYFDAEGQKVNITGGGLPPSPVGGIAILDDGTEVRFCIGCGGDNSSIGASTPGSAASHKQGLGRVYWNIRQ